MTTEGFDQELYNRYFGYLGAIQSCSLLLNETQTSHPVFLIKTSDAVFVLKKIQSADALFGSRGLERLNCVTKIISELAGAGLEIEKIIPNCSGELVTTTPNGVFRLYDFVSGRPFNQSVEDQKQAAHALKTFHDLGTKCLSKALKDQLQKFETPYPLCQTSAELENIKDFITLSQRTRFDSSQLQREAFQEFPDILKAWKVIEKAVTVTKEFSPTKETLVHLDFHPGNILFSERGPTILDCDSLMMGDPLKCFSFAVMRFASGVSMNSLAEQGPTRFQVCLEVWRRAYFGEASKAQTERIVQYMLFIEIEKVLRILTRVQATGEYLQFIPNIRKRHLPNIKFLLSL